MSQGSQRPPCGLSATPDEASLAARYIDLCRVSATLGDRELNESAEALHCLLQQLCHESHSLLRAARGRPVLYCYQSDATSFKCRLQLNQRSREGKALQRRGRALEEMLSERGLLKFFDASGDAKMVMLMGVPRPLRQGKTADVHFVAACDFQRPLRLADHDSILITHLCFRGLPGAFLDFSWGFHGGLHEAFMWPS